MTTSAPSSTSPTSPLRTEEAASTIDNTVANESRQPRENSVTLAARLCDSVAELTTSLASSRGFSYLGGLTRSLIEQFVTSSTHEEKRRVACLLSNAPKNGPWPYTVSSGRQTHQVKASVGQTLGDEFNKLARVLAHGVPGSTMVRLLILLELEEEGVCQIEDRDGDLLLLLLED